MAGTLSRETLLTSWAGCEKRDGGTKVSLSPQEPTSATEDPSLGPHLPKNAGWDQASTHDRGAGEGGDSASERNTETLAFFTAGLFTFLLLLRFRLFLSLRDFCLLHHGRCKKIVCGQNKA